MTRHAIAAASSPPTSASELDGNTILSPKQTYQVTSLSSATIWRLRQKGEFPDPVRLSPGRMGWRRRDVESWLAARQDIADYVRPSPNPLARPRPAKVPEPVPPRRRR